MTLRFLGSEQAHSAHDAVTLQHGSEPRAPARRLHDSVRPSYEEIPVITADGPA